MSLTKVSYSMIQGEIGNVLDYGVVANDVTAGLANNVAIALAIASGKTLFWPAGTYTFASRIKVGSVNATAKWKGAGINDTILAPASTFTDTEFIRVESSTTDNSPTTKTFNVLFEDMTFSGLGGASRSSLPILYGMYVNWAHFMKINRCSFYGWNGSVSNSSVGLYIGAWANGTTTFNQMNTIQECEFTFCSNGIISGGTNKQSLYGGDNNAGTIMNTRIGGFGSANGYSIGIELKGGYTNRIVGCDIESHTIGIINRGRYNYISETLAEQNDSDFETISGEGSLVTVEACNFPLSNVQDYAYAQQFSRNGYLNFVQSLGQPENLIIDGTFESSLYTSTIYGGTVTARSASANYYGAYSRNFLYAPGAVSATTRANLIIDPANTYFNGWYTLMFRAKSPSGASITIPINSSDYTEQIGIGQGGGGTDYLEIGNFILVAGGNRSGNVGDAWKIYAAFIKFDDATLTNLNLRVQNSDTYVDFVGLFKGMVGCIPAPRTQFDVATDISGIAPGSTATIVDLTAYPTSCNMIIDSLSVGAVRRIAGLQHTLQNGTSAGYSYNTVLNNTWGYNTATTASNDHISINTQSKLLWFQRASAYSSGTVLQSTIKLLTF
jgi:hypothetical protein